MSEGRAGGGFPSAHAEPDRAALHENDRVMAVLPGGRSGQAGYEPRFDLPHHLFEAEG